MKAFRPLLLFLALATNAQLPDTIQLRLDRLADPMEKLFALDSISTRSLRNNSELFSLLVSEGLRISAEISNDSIYNNFLIKKGINHVYQDQYDSARSIYQSVLESSNSKYHHAMAYSELGITYYHESNDKKALENWIAAFHLWEDIGDTARIGGITNNIGVIYRYLGDHKASNNYLLKALRFKTLMGETFTLGSTLHNLGINFDDLGQVDSALFYLRKAKSTREEYNDVRGLAKTYTSLGHLHDHTDNLDSAEFYFRESVRIDHKLNDQVAIPTDEYSLADILFKKGEYTESMLLVNKALQASRDVRVQADLLILKSKLHDKRGEFKLASEVKGELLALKDSINQAEKEASLQELQVSFDTEQKEAEIAQLSAENQIQKLQAKQNRQTRLILIIVSAALVIIAILFYSRFRSKAKSNALLDAKNQELAKLNQTKDRLFSIISHDLKSPLSSFHTITKSLTDNWEQLEKEQLKSFIESLRDSSANVRDMMDNLLKWALAQTDQLEYKAEIVDASGILSKVQQQLKSVSDVKRIRWKTDIKSQHKVLADSQFIEIVIRNIMSNALKFSEMESEVAIAVEEVNSKQVITISDHGVGMEQSEIDKLVKGEILAQDIRNSPEKGTGLGLTLCTELMSKMKAQMEITSEKNKGTTFKLIFEQAA